MINRGTTDLLEDVIDRFEETWSPDSQRRIEALLDEYGLTDDDEAIVELIRIDIELRYERGLSIELDEYLSRFEILRARPERVAEIAFEDFRSRAAHGCSVTPSRWSGLPGVRREYWFQELAREASIVQKRSRTVASGDVGRATADRASGSNGGAAIEPALEEIGFQLVQRIGEGAFSQVYLANQSELADRFVVLKVVEDSLTEPEYMALLQHTNIVPIYSFHRVLSRSVICMPYAGRVTLDDFLKAQNEASPTDAPSHSVSRRNGESLVETVLGQLDGTKVAAGDEGIGKPENLLGASDLSTDGVPLTHPLEKFRSLDCNGLAIWIFQRLASALAHAHARGVLHNDLKPSNVLIRNDGEPALLDFNLSQSLGDKTLRRIGGTLPYMAPETYRAMMGQSVRADAASDQYGLGVMLFQFVTGRLPYPVPASLAAIDLATAVEARRSAPDWQDTDTVEPGLKAIIDRCLQYEPGQRYASTDDLQLDLQNEQQSMALVHTPEPVGWRLRKWTRRHPRAIASTLVAALLISVLAPVAYYSVVSARANRVLRLNATYRSFADESSKFLSALMADPNRARDANVASGVGVLDRYNLLEREGIQGLLSPYEGEEKEVVRQTMLRHVVHIGTLETEHLSAIRLSDAEAAKDFDRLDRLIQTAKWVDDETPSRARLFLESERARLSGNVKRYELLKEAAEAIHADSDSELYLEAVRVLANDDYVTAAELLASLADRNSVPSALRWTMLGRAQYVDRRFEDAKLSFTQSIAHASDSATLRLLKGRCHFELKEYALAEQDYLQAIDLDTENLGAWTQLGLVYQSRGDFEESLRCYSRALEIRPGRILALLKRAQVYRKLGHEDLADADYQAVLIADCDDANELFYRSRARREEDPEAALKDLRRAYELDPDRVFLLHETGHILAVDLGRHREAIEYFDRVLEVQPNNEFVLIDRALSRVRLGQTALALADTQKAMREPNAAKTIFQAACVHALIDKKINQQRALTLLAMSIHKGYQPKKLADDPDLASLRDSDEFRAISRFYRTSQRGKSRNNNSPSADEVPTSFSPL